MFDRDGFEGATVAAIRAQASASNGSFFHVFASKKELAGALFLGRCSAITPRFWPRSIRCLSAQDGIDRLIRAHLDWVVEHRREARYLFEISRSEWAEDVRDEQRAQNARFAEGIERWRAPLVDARRTSGDDAGCCSSARSSGRRRSSAAPFCRAAIAPIRGSRRINSSPARSARWSDKRRETRRDRRKRSADFAPIATRIRDNVGRQGFMALVGAELSELARGSCTHRGRASARAVAAARLLPWRRHRIPGRQRHHDRGGDLARPAGADGGIQAQPAVAGDRRAPDLPCQGDQARAPGCGGGRGRLLVSDGVEKHTATALASIAMLNESITASISKARPLRRPGLNFD